MLTLYRYPPGLVAVSFSRPPLGPLKTTSDPFGSALQFVSRVTDVTSASTTFNCAIPKRLQDEPSIPHTFSWKLPTGNVVAGAAGAMRSAVNPGTLNEPALRVAETPTGTLLRLRSIGAGGEPGTNDNVTM